VVAHGLTEAEIRQTCLRTELDQHPGPERADQIVTERQVIDPGRKHHPLCSEVH
jgi:hypothetical protein